MKVGSLFAGYGGLDLAVESVWPQASLVWVSEFDKHPSAILAQRFPGVPNLGDITAIDWDSVEPVDILLGGFPCQDVSHAGNRAGIKPGTRSGLWAHMAHAIAKLRPKIVVIENVSGLLSAHADSDVEPCAWCVGDQPNGHMRALGAVLADLAEIGFDAAWTSVRASDVGACHRRERVFIVAADREGDEHREPAVRRVRPEPRHGTAPDADDRRRGERLRAQVGQVPVAGEGGSRPDLTLLPTPVVNDMGEGKTLEWWDDWAPRQQSADGRPSPHGKSLAIEAQRLLPTPTTHDERDGQHLRAITVDAATRGAQRGIGLNHLFEGELPDGSSLLPTPKASDGPNGGPGMRNSSGVADALPGVVTLLPTPTAQAAKHGSTPDVTANGYGGNLWDLPTLLPTAAAEAFGPYAAAVARWAAVIGRPAPAPTEPGKDGRPRLSPAFVEWMMGLPAGWVTDVDIPRSAQLKALGNGVVPQQAAAAIRHLIGAFA